jgi:LmbE family N-acetylglucosaminyl deacetylase
MGFVSTIKALCQRNGVHPRRWLTGFISYPRYLGYVKPQLVNATEEEFRVRRQLLARAWEPRALTVPVGKRLLVLCPHPDDESIGAGGLLLAHRNSAEIHLVCLCTGEGGGSMADADVNPETTKHKLIETRKAEFNKTAEALQAASVRHLDFPDGNIPCSTEAVGRMGSIVREIRPDVVLLPWLLDNHVDHRRANVLYAWACADLEATVLGYEIWSMLEPNAVLDISTHLPGKLALIGNYTSQLRTVDYAGYASALARVRAHHAALHPRRAGAAEAFMALPNREYCELVQALYGPRGHVCASAAASLGLAGPEALAVMK